MKSFIKYILQKSLGLESYLFLFSLYTYYTLKINRKEKDFFHLLSYLKEEDVVLDIGANIGVMSAHLAKKLPKGKVIAFEPIPMNYKVFQKLQQYLHHNNIELYTIALGNKNSKTSMIVPLENGASLHGLSHIQSGGNTAEKGNYFEVEMKTLDSLELNAKHLKAIKLDVENYEFEVLKGAQKTIEKYRPIIYTELWMNENRTNCFNYILGFNYSIYTFMKNEWTEVKDPAIKSQNFFFIPNQSKA